MAITIGVAGVNAAYLDDDLCARRNPVLRAEGRITTIDVILATAVLLGLALNAAIGWRWADPLAGYVLRYYAVREARESLLH